MGARHGKFNVRSFAFYWNAALSLFSICGVAACVPVLINELWTNGLYFTVCAPMSWYASGLGGFFVALFIYSKVAELVDTVLLLLAGKPVIALQWWHHSTVLLYCWHSYSVRIATGAWFACMNYTVHSIMYGYFAITATKYRKRVVPYAIYITLLQLLQMLVGMFVTVKAVMYQAAGEECHVNKTNSILGLTMYASYFVLFFKLFVDNYYLKPKSPKKQPSVRDVMRSVSRKITQVIDDDSNEDEKAKPEQLGEKRAEKKTELSGLRLRVWIVPEVRGMMKFARRRQQVPVQEHRSLRIYVQALQRQSCEAGTQRRPCTARATQRRVCGALSPGAWHPKAYFSKTDLAGPEVEERARL